MMRWEAMEGDGTHGCRVTVLNSVQDVVTYLLSPVYVYSEIRIRITAVCLHVYVAVGWLAGSGD